MEGEGRSAPHLHCRVLSSLTCALAWGTVAVGYLPLKK